MQSPIEQLRCVSTDREFVLLGNIVSGVFALAVIIALTIAVCVSGQHAVRSTRIDLRNDHIARRVDHGDLVRIVLRHK